MGKRHGEAVSSERQASGVRRQASGIAAGGFRKLLVWQRSKALAVAIYRVTTSQPLAADYGLRDQLRRAAVSICSNIAEGDARQTDKESIQYFFIAKGSVAEVAAQLEIVLEVYAVAPAPIADLICECDEIGAMLQGLIDHRRK
jgi:four helix bundle protein